VGKYFDRLTKNTEVLTNLHLYIESSLKLDIVTNMSEYTYVVDLMRTQLVTNTNNSNEIALKDKIVELTQKLGEQNSLLASIQKN
jgi:hypothetical protein